MRGPANKNPLPPLCLSGEKGSDSPHFKQSLDCLQNQLDLLVMRLYNRITPRQYSPKAKGPQAGSARLKYDVRYERITPSNLGRMGRPPPTTGAAGIPGLFPGSLRARQPDRRTVGLPGPAGSGQHLPG